MNDFFKIKEQAKEPVCTWPLAPRSGPVQHALNDLHTDPFYEGVLSLNRLRILKSKKGGDVFEPNVDGLLACGTANLTTDHVRVIECSDLNGVFVNQLAGNIRYHFDKLAAPGMRIRVTPDSLVIYTRGATYTNERDVPSTGSQIMNVAVELGRRKTYTGGDFKLALPNDTRYYVFDRDDTDLGRDQFPFYAWYLHSKHAMSSVFSGARIVMFYSISLAPSNESYIWPLWCEERFARNLPWVACEEEDRLVHATIVAKKVADAVEQKELDSQISVFALSRCYPVSGNPCEILKGRDLVLFNVLSQRFRCRLINLSVYLAIDQTLSDDEGMDERRHPTNEGHEFYAGPTLVDFPGSADELCERRATLYDAGGYNLYHGIIEHCENDHEDDVPDTYYFHLVGLHIQPTKKRQRDLEDLQDTAIKKTRRIETYFGK